MSNDTGNREVNAPIDILRRHSLKKHEGELLITEVSDVYEELTQEDLAPEGGWGWMVALGMTITFIVMFCPIPCLPIIFGDLLEASGSAGSSMTILNTIWTITWSISGLCTNVLLKKFPMRAVGVSGALLFSASVITSAIAINVFQLGLTLFIQGVGMGIMCTICQANFNAFFVKRRATVMSATQIIMSLFGVLYPMMIGDMMDVFGFRGTAALVGAMSLHAVFGMMLMHPVDSYLRNPKEVLAKRQASHRKLSHEKSLMNNTTRTAEVISCQPLLEGANLKVEMSRWSSLGNLTENSSHQTLLAETLRARVASSSNVESARDPRSRVNSMSRTPLGTSVMSSPSSSIANLGVAIAEISLRKKMSVKTISDSYNNNSKANADQNGTVEGKKEQGTIEMLVDLFDISIFKDCTFVIMSCGVSAAITSDVVFQSLLPLAMFNQGYSTGDASRAVATACSAEFVTKIGLTIMTMFLDVRAKTLVFLAMIAMAFAKFAYFYLESTLTGIMVSMVLIGCVRVWIFVPQPLVVVENYPVQKYAACYGIFAIINGSIFIIANPIFGIIRDWTGSFSVCQLGLIALNCAFILPWGIELAAYYRNRRKQGRMNAIN